MVGTITDGKVPAHSGTITDGVVIPTTWQMSANSKTKLAITAEYKVMSKRSVGRRETVTVTVLQPRIQ